MNCRRLSFAIALTLAATLAACDAPAPAPVAQTASVVAPVPAVERVSPNATKVAAYAEVALTADLSHLSDGDRQAIRLLLQAGEIADALFWQQVAARP